MNKIVFAGKNFGGDKPNRYLRILISGERTVAVPPNCDYGGEDAADLRVIIEQPILPLKEVAAFEDGGKIRQAADLAEEFFNLEKSEAVMQALGNLLVSLVCFYTSKKKFSPVTELVREDIEKNLSNATYALDDFIKRLPLNYDYVRKLFLRETGATPRAYLENARMELAASLLSSGLANKYSSYSVSQVAEACGYAEPLYFSRVFKKRFGVSPSEYRG